MASTGEPFGLFWDSQNGDRTYSSESFERWLKKFFTTGVFNGDLQVSASSGMTLSIAQGYANVDGKVRFWDSAFTLTLEASNSTYPRIDTIVITRDNVNRQITCEVVKGAYAGNSPQPTAPIRNAEKYQIVLAQIYIEHGVTDITQSDITDTRPDTDLCGYITGTVEELDFSAFTAQFEAYFAEFKEGNEEDFDAWFQEMKDQLSTDAAGHLQLEIDDHTSQIETLENDVDSLDSSKADKSDLASISITGSTNNTGSTIKRGTYFYKSGTLVRAKVDIANGATLTQNTNYEVITAGALNVLNTSGEVVGLGNASGNGTKTVSLSSDLNNFKYVEFVFTTGGSFYLLDSIIMPISLFKITNASNLIRLKYDSFFSDVYYESDTTIKAINNNATNICMIYGIK